MPSVSPGVPMVASPLRAHAWRARLSKEWVLYLAARSAECLVRKAELEKKVAELEKKLEKVQQELMVSKHQAGTSPP